MSWISLRMLLGDPGKYLGCVAGIAISSLLVVQQGAIFCGIMLQTASQVRDVNDAAIWVMDPSVQFVDDLKRLSDNDVYRVRGVEGVAWAVRFYKGLGQAQLANGEFHKVILLGLDDATLVGSPPEIVAGSVHDLARPDAILIDEAGFRILWPDEPVRPGKVIEMNDRRAVVVGICRASPTFQTFPIVYTRYSQAARFVPQGRRVMSYVLADPAPGHTVAEVNARIGAETGLRALTKEQFVWATMQYFLWNTGILVSFAVTVLLGFLVGIAIAGQTFYLFTVENLPGFVTLKAMGTSNERVVGMILLQATTIGAIGYGLGVGAATLFGRMIEGSSRLTFYMPWEVLAGAGLAVLLIVAVSSLLSIRRVLVLEAGMVLRR